MTSRAEYRSATVATGSAPHRIFAQLRIPRRLDHMDVILKQGCMKSQKTRTFAPIGTSG